MPAGGSFEIIVIGFSEFFCEMAMMATDTSPGPPPSGPLAGVRVLDLTRGMPGALATMLLADYGAEVVMIESPRGTPLRRTRGHSVWNRGKRSVVADLDDDADGRSSAALADGADVVIEDHRPGALAPRPRLRRRRRRQRRRRLLLDLRLRPGGQPPRPPRLRRGGRRPPRDHERVGRQPRGPDLPRPPRRSTTPRRSSPRSGSWPACAAASSRAPATTSTSRCSTARWPCTR